MLRQTAGNVQNKKTQLAGMFVLLHAGLLIFSLSNVCSKIAGSHDLFTRPFFLWYGLLLLCLFAYAIIWQQVLKAFPLTMAYANKPITLVWGMIFGAIIFHEQITWNMIAGAAVIVAGICLIETEKRE